ncbi:hypothetical protein ONZ45_g6457 [Pleurotus djamor]|nr:hypothetical protein ONZ45_g18761 [Pleurotus djamor]KAJ8516202.1 hypothetical protein ONZ45_g6457 [Pleurotus djamor]
MRASAIRQLQIVSRSSLKLKQSTINPAPKHQKEQLKQPTIIDVLLKRKEKAGEAWPTNLRVEPVITKEALKNVRAEARSDLKALLRER